MTPNTQKLRQAALQAIENLAARAIVCEEAVRTVAHHLDVELADTEELDALVERILKCIEKEAALSDSPPKAADHQDSQ